MLKISEASSLALHAMALLAEKPEAMLSTREISSRLEVSEAHLSKVLQRLHKQGLVRSIRGPKGGFMLERNPDAISLIEIYQAIEGNLSISGCLLSSNICRGANCVLGNLLQTVNQEAREYLLKTRLSDLGLRLGKKIKT